MGRLTLVMGVVGLSLVVVAAAIAAPGPKATGGVEAQAGGTTLWLDFNAKPKKSGGAKGRVSYSNSTGASFTGKVGCYAQNDNQAVFAGEITGGTYAENYFRVQVEDNGQGGKAAGPDRVRVQILANPPSCTLTNSFPGTVTDGNLQVHRTD